jgi:hypothetical protein
MTTTINTTNEAARLCRLLENMTESRDAMIEDRNLLDNEVARLKELLEKVLFELEKVPFQTPKLTAFTAHRLAVRFREQRNQLTK